ncbi:MAG: universal stress protein [Chitinophagaceae bacterium]|nr:universal stress protein [Chitinophagaceae bacterium]
MKKILLAFDGTHFSNGAFEFARKLNELEPVLVTGAFLPQAQAASFWSYADGMSGPQFVPLYEDAGAEVTKANKAKFEELCQRNGMEYRVHEDLYDFALPELKTETRYADLLIIGSEVFYENLGSSPNEYLQEILHKSECPVMVVPEKYDFPKTNVLCYDGTESSVYAIKQYAYLFPELVKRSTLLVYVNDDGNNEFPQQVNIEELVSRHFPDLTLMKLDMKPEKYFSNWINNRVSALIVTGSFGRSALSQLFRKSIASDVIAEHKLPVFIAHR